MKLPLILIFQFLTLSSFGQAGIFKLDSIGTSYAKDLISNGFTESAIVLTTGCTGCYSIDGCQCDGGTGETYIFWDNEGLTLKKINCCSNFYGKKTQPSNVLEELTNDPSPVFSSQFEFDYIEVHGVFNRIKLVTKDTTYLIHIPSELFNDDYKYRTANLNQPAKKYLDELKATVKFANKSEWTLEH